MEPEFHDEKKFQISALEFRKPELQNKKKSLTLGSDNLATKFTDNLGNQNPKTNTNFRFYW